MEGEPNDSYLEGRYVFHGKMKYAFLVHGHNKNGQSIINQIEQDHIRQAAADEDIKGGQFLKKGNSSDFKKSAEKGQKSA